MNDGLDTASETESDDITREIIERYPPPREQRKKQRGPQQPCHTATPSLPSSQTHTVPSQPTAIAQCQSEHQPAAPTLSLSIKQPEEVQTASPLPSQTEHPTQPPPSQPPTTGNPTIASSYQSTTRFLRSMDKSQDHCTKFPSLREEGPMTVVASGSINKVGNAQDHQLHENDTRSANSDSSDEDVADSDPQWRQPLSSEPDSGDEEECDTPGNVSTETVNISAPSVTKPPAITVLSTVCSSTAQTATAEISAPPPRKRKYNSTKRIVSKDGHGLCTMRQRWKERLDSITPQEVATWQCCRTLKCFSTAKLDHLMKNMVKFQVHTDQSRRKAALATMLTTSGHFIYDGERVCSEFLNRAFRFSRDLQQAVKSGTESCIFSSTERSTTSFPASTIVRHPEHEAPASQSHDQPDLNAQSVGQSVGQSASHDIVPQRSDITYDITPTVITEPSVIPPTSRGGPSNDHGCAMEYEFPSDEITKSDAMIIFLERLVSSTAERMPDSGEAHLPFFEKKQVYEVFCREYELLYNSNTIPTFSYFTEVWKKHCSWIKVRKSTRFTKCSTCEQITAALREATRGGVQTDAILRGKAIHLDFIARERREYRRKCELAILYPTSYLSLVVDGADQTKFSLPHFTTSVKDQRGHGLAVHLIGLLRHAALNRLRLFTMTDEHASGANHIVESIHRLINEIEEAEERLPPHLFLQLDNCWRENKNRYLMAYLEYLFRLSVFQSIEVGFLPIGHTHSDIDQTFSCTSRRLRTEDAITMEDMHGVLSKCYNKHTTVSSLKQVANWSALCERSSCLHKVHGISQYRFFKFTRASANQNVSENPVHCLVRCTVDEQWSDLPTDNGPCFLRFVPDLANTPPEQLTSPADIDDVTLRIESEENRITPVSKLRSLIRLRNEVYRTRLVSFHWDLSTIVETKGNIRSLLDASPATLPSFEEPVCTPENAPSYKYPIHSFVAVKACASVGTSTDVFWIGEVLETFKGKSNKISRLRVLWYGVTNDKCKFTGKYEPCKVTYSNGTMKDWIDTVDTDSVMIHFKSLTRKKQLPANIVTHLRNAQ